MNPDEVKITKRVIREVYDPYSEENRTMHYEVSFIPSKSYGFFEYYDDLSGGEYIHAEGGLWFEDRKCVDYDGVYQLDDIVIELCQDMGLNMSEIE